MKLGQIASSKTINFNVWVPIIMEVLAAAGVPIPQEVIVGVVALGNFILRFFTKKPLSGK